MMLIFYLVCILFHLSSAAEYFIVDVVISLADYDAYFDLMAVLATQVPQPSGHI